MLSLTIENEKWTDGNNVFTSTVIQFDICTHKKRRKKKDMIVMEKECYAMVTPLRKAASYEQRKTNLGNQNFRRRIITQCHILRSTNKGILVTVT